MSTTDPMLLVGMDVSGDEEYSNYKFLGVVIGTNESIMSLSSHMGSHPEHMSKIPHNEKDSVIEKLEFDSRNRMAICIKLDRNSIVEKIENSRQAKYRKIGKGKILRTYERIVMQEVRKRIEGFVLSHGDSINDITIQCDKDARPFARAGSLQFTQKGAAYRISDYVAWCNNKGRNPETVIEVDFTDQIPERMKQILRLN